MIWIVIMLLSNICRLGSCAIINVTRFHDITVTLYCRNAWPGIIGWTGGDLLIIKIKILYTLSRRLDWLRYRDVIGIRVHELNVYHDFRFSHSIDTPLILDQSSTDSPHVWPTQIGPANKIVLNRVGVSACSRVSIHVHLIRIFIM